MSALTETNKQRIETLSEKKMTDTTPEKNDAEEMMIDIEWENRQLCNDGNCIGVIGPDGCCKACGKPYDGELPDTGIPDSVTDQSIDVPRETSPIPDHEEPSTHAPGEDADSEWKNRRLCSDGNCIGVIGPDGCCKVCGKSYTP